jgi:signal peptidase II
MSKTCPALASSRSKITYSLLWIAIFVILFDQLTKWLVYTYLPIIDSSTYWYPYGGIGIFQNFMGVEFSINHMTNSGAAWGILGNYQLPLIILRVGLIISLCIYFFYFNDHSSWRLPMVLIIVGAIGNVLDFFVYGHVVDMFHFVLWGYDFPVFNLADSAISIGIASLFFLSWFEDKR